MGLSIKNPETERAIRQLAAEQGVSITRAVHEAVTDKLKKPARTAEQIEAEVQNVLAYFASQDGWQPDPLPTHEEMDSWIYDEDGMPTR